MLYTRGTTNEASGCKNRRKLRTQDVRPQRRAKHQKNLYTLYYPLNKKRVKVQVKVQVCRRERHAAILNFNHAVTSLRRRNPQDLKLIRADFASL